MGRKTGLEAGRAGPRPGFIGKQAAVTVRMKHEFQGAAAVAVVTQAVCSGQYCCHLPVAAQHLGYHLVEGASRL
jgi:hypothetical protein